MIQLVKGLNKPYRRIDFMIGGVCQIIDGLVDIISFGYARTGLNIWWTDKCLDRFCKYLKQNEVKK
jgi:hypothetical protein